MDLGQKSHDECKLIFYRIIMIIDSKCKICRRAGEKLFLKGDRCFTPKCAFERKPYTPGKLQSERKHRSMITEYGTQLREKQKVRNVYRLSEKQFSNYVKKATSSRGVSPTNKLYEQLERRLDNVVFRLGLAPSRSMARQLVTHGHVLVNNRKIDVPSHKIKKGDELSIREGSKKIIPFANISEKLKKHNTPAWLKLDTAKMTAKVEGLPTLEKADMTYNLTSIIEFYSR